MATHDYVIDNSTGANVRADINNALAAIVSNNSSSSEPSTKYAYMWWADTTNGVLKIRNSANDGWVELLQLDGTLTLEDGSASTPALAFRDDLNTGIYSSAADTFNVATAGVERMELGATTIFNESGGDIDFRIEGDAQENLFYVDAGNDRVGINTNSPHGILGVKGTGTSGAAASAGYDEFVIEGGNEDIGMCFLSPAANNKTQTIAFGDSNNNKSGRIKYEHANDAFAFDTGGSERVRLDSSGRVLIGSTSSRTIANHAARLQLQGTDYQTATFSIVNNANAGNGAFLFFASQRSGSVGGSTVVQNGDSIGSMRFFAGDGTDINSYCAEIKASIDDTPGSNDVPGRITFATTADGASSPTERMRIDASGNVGIGTTGPGKPLDVAGEMRANAFIGRTNISAPSEDTSIYRAADNTLAFGTAQTERMRIDSSGQVLIGLTSSGGNVTYLETNQPQASDNACAMFQSSTSSSLSGTHALRIQGHGFNSSFQAAHGIKFVNADDQDRSYQAVLFKKQDGSTTVGSITYNQNSTSFNTSSDYRLKENAVAISDGITRLKTLKPYRFNFKENPSKTLDGFFAHEVTAVPEAIAGDKDAMKAESWYQEGDTIPSGKTVGMPKTYSSTEMEIQSLDQSKLVPLLVAAVQELITKVETLEAA